MDLFTPGPTDISEVVLSAMAQNPLYHRSSEFKILFESVQNGLQYLFQTENNVYTLAGSGTAAMEFSLVNTLSRGEEIIVCGGGKFADRWSRIANAYGVNVKEIQIDWGLSISIDKALQAVEKNKRAKAFCITHCETSSGALNNVYEILKNIRHKFQGLIIVDCITTLGVHEFYFDEWGIDIAICSSQKGLACGAGLAFVALSNKAEEYYFNSDLPKFYFDLKKYKKAQENNLTPFTPAINLISGLEFSLKNIQENGLESIWEKHTTTGKFIREEIEKLGINIFAEYPSNGVIACELPYQNFIKRLKDEKQIIVSGGQDILEGKIFRIGNMGNVSLQRSAQLISAIKTLL